LVALDRGRIAGVTVSSKVLAAARQCALSTIEDEKSYCEDETCEGCTLCQADITVWDGGCFGNADDLFTTAELVAHRRALMAGEVVHLSR
jgi:hypothetical protein